MPNRILVAVVPEFGLYESGCNNGPFTDLTGVVDPDTNLTQYLYNAAGEQTETIDPLGHAS